MKLIKIVNKIIISSFKMDNKKSKFFILLILCITVYSKSDLNINKIIACVKLAIVRIYEDKDFLDNVYIDIISEYKLSNLD